MKWLHEGQTLEDVYTRVREAKERVLLTDYDGTLAPFVYDRERARPYPGLMEILEEIAKAPRSNLVVISGRSIQDLSRLFKLDVPVELWGSHGWERQNLEGERSTWPISDENREGMYEVISWAEREDISSRLEVKPASVALHWRGTDAKTREHLIERSAKVMEPIAAETGLELHKFDGGRELRVPGRSKGNAVEHVLERIGRNFMMAYLGDDRTDEDAFDVVGDHGLKVLVRTFARETKADLWLRPPRELQRFLEGWLAALTA